MPTRRCTERRTGRAATRFSTTRCTSARCVAFIRANELNRVLERDELTVLYQPQIDLRAGQVWGVEALLGWRHPERGILEPSEFVPLAEETGVIVPMGEWVLAEAARQLECWSADGGDAAALVMAVNLSPRQFADPGLVDMVTRVLAESAIPPARLCLQITESTVASDGAGAAAALRAISSLGVALAIDDFGTGYSSLGALGEFPIDVLKIDRSFVGRLGDARRLGVVGAVVTLAQSLGLKAVTEGVERRDQVGELRRLGCDAAQGNLFCRPRAAADVAALLRAEFEVAP